MNTRSVGGGGVEFGTTAGTAAEGNDSRILNAQPKGLFVGGLAAGFFDLNGAATEPILKGVAGTNGAYTVLEFDGADAVGHKAYFTIPADVTARYQGGSINIALDVFFAGATLTNAETILMSCGMKEVNYAEKGGDSVDIALPTSSAGYSEVTYTITASGETNNMRRLLITIAADASLTAGQVWRGYIQRKSATDTSLADSNLVGITLYE